ARSRALAARRRPWRPAWGRRPGLPTTVLVLSVFANFSEARIVPREFNTEHIPSPPAAKKRPALSHDSAPRRRSKISRLASTPLGRTAAIVRNRRHITYRGDCKADRLQRAQCGFAP